MEEKTLHIDNMVCDRCKLVVRGILEEFGWEVHYLELGEVSGIAPLGFDAKDKLAERLQAVGFALAKEGSLSTRMKGLIIDYVHNESKWNNRVLSEVLATALNRSYGFLSRSFSEEVGRTIEDFYQAHRIERASQLLHQTDLPISEIAPLLRYGTAAHFSNSFRRHTGQSPSTFRKSGTYVPKDLTKI
ncbi:AraC family transcriptional regulator [Lewinellaceae bacterium SD302]|nr:AraC family transcriptional regulator [Lewinellaceae bacterium SD302]